MSCVTASIVLSIPRCALLIQGSYCFHSAHVLEQYIDVAKAVEWNRTGDTEPDVINHPFSALLSAPKNLRFFPSISTTSLFQD